MEKSKIFNVHILDVNENEFVFEFKNKKYSQTNQSGLLMSENLGLLKFPLKNGNFVRLHEFDFNTSSEQVH